MTIPFKGVGDMDSKKSRLWVLLIVLLIAAFANFGFALITGSHGSEPVQDRGWPSGSVQIANLPARLGYWEGPPYGGGEYHFLYRCENTDQFNQALEIFAAIRADKLGLVVHNGPEYSFWLKGNDEELEREENRVDWTFMVWVPQSWDRLYNNPKSLYRSDHPNFRKPVAAPRIDLYLGQGAVAWKDVTVPENVVVIDKRPGAVSPEFAGSGLVQGKVLDMATRQPLFAAQITLVKRGGGGSPTETMSGITDALGLCRIDKVAQGYYDVEVSAPGYAGRKTGVYNNKRPEYHEFETSLARPGCIKGVVTDVDGRPIEGVEVSVRNVVGTDGFGYKCIGDRAAVSDKQGRFEISSLPLGRTNLHCRKAPWHMKDSIFEQYQIPSDGIRLTMVGTGIICGKVVDKDGGIPSGDVHIRVRPHGEQLGKWGGSARVKEDGSFEFTGVPPGEYFIGTEDFVIFEPDKTHTKSITVEVGKTYELEIIHK